MRQEPRSLDSEEGAAKEEGRGLLCVFVCLCVHVRNMGGGVWKDVVFCEAEFGRCVSVDAYVMLLFCSCGLCVCG